MKFSLSIFILILSVFFCTSCKKTSKLISVITFDELQTGDFNPEKNPPFVPNQSLRQYLNKPVQITGQLTITEEGLAYFTREKERWLTPLRVIACKPVPDFSPRNTYHGDGRGVLRILPKYDGGGKLQTVYMLEEFNFIPNTDTR